MNQLIQRIYSAGTVVGRSGQSHKLHSGIDREEGQLLFNIIRNDSSILKTLEVGCAYGLSSLHICSALQGRTGASHTIIDPFQNTKWDGVGIRNLEEAGIQFFNLIERKSEFALPRLLEEMEGKFDLIFIDGWHTFDHTLLDGFYANRLLRVGGYLTIDDVDFPSIRRVVDYFNNYPCYQIYGSVSKERSKPWINIFSRYLLLPIYGKTFARLFSRTIYRKTIEYKTMRMVVLKKVSDDNRNWDWHDDSF